MQGQLELRTLAGEDGLFAFTRMLGNISLVCSRGGEPR